MSYSFTNSYFVIIVEDSSTSSRPVLSLLRCYAHRLQILFPSLHTSYIWPTFYTQLMLGSPIYIALLRIIPDFLFAEWIFKPPQFCLSWWEWGKLTNFRISASDETVGSESEGGKTKIFWTYTYRQYMHDYPVGREALRISCQVKKGAEKTRQFWSLWRWLEKAEIASIAQKEAQDWVRWGWRICCGTGKIQNSRERKMSIRSSKLCLSRLAYPTSLIGV